MRQTFCRVGVLALLLWSLRIFANLELRALKRGYLVQETSATQNIESGANHNPHVDRPQSLKSIKPYSNRTVAVCVPVKDEESRLDEFTDYYTALRFHMIYFYDNSLDFETKQWGEEKRRLGFPIKVTHYPRRPMQMPMLRDCSERALADGHTWVAHFDIDEFLVLKKHEDVVSFLEEYCPQGALSLFWVTMGTGGNDVYSPQPLAKRFRYRTDYPSREMKSFVVLEHINMTRGLTPHYPYLKNGYKRLITSGTEVSGNRVDDGMERFRSSDVALLYHFKYRSHKEYKYKRLYKGNVYWIGEFKRKKKFVREALSKTEPQGQEFDDSAWRAMRKLLPAYRYYDELFPDQPQATPEKVAVGTIMSVFNRTVAVCVPVNNGEAYLDEFTDYYSAIGFHAFYFYDTTDEFELKQWGEEKRRLGFPINMMHWTARPKRFVRLNCAKQALADGHTWVATFDLDDFLILKKHNNIVPFLEEYCPQGALSIHRVNMGTGGRETYSPQPVTKRFTYRTEYPSDMVRTIAVLKHIDLNSPSNPQYPILKTGYKIVTTSGHICVGRHQRCHPSKSDVAGSVDIALLYHYGYKSYKEYLDKRLGHVLFNDTSNESFSKMDLRNIPEGQDFDDTAWKAVKNVVKSYEYYEKLFPDPA